MAVLGILILIGAVFYGGLHIWAKSYFRKDEEKKSIFENRVNQIMQENGAKVSRIYTGISRDYGIAYDDQTDLICIVNGNKTVMFGYKDIVESEIMEDGIQINRTSRSSQVGGALIGGVLAGGVGAIVGGLSGSSKTSNKVERIELKVVISNKSEPVQYFLFYVGSGLSKDDNRYRELIKEANHWHSLISVLIKRADEESIQQVSIIDQPSAVRSIADELAKLAQLQKDGLITQDEFLVQKAKLLA
ncbi:SHOCT domain-containing protein [Paenibacillus sp. MMO-177]|uniref:SHOCT domain-containing protein n=1 Tax=Paenibacillus sp. MMO-177 TaxID=3081289 RepID=UPI0030177BB0